MKVHRGFKSSLFGSLFANGILLLFGLFSLLIAIFVAGPAESASSNNWHLAITLYLWVCSLLLIFVGISQMADHISFLKLLTHLVEENISVEEMAVTTRVVCVGYEEFGGQIDGIAADLRFLGNSHDQFPAITLGGLARFLDNGPDQPAITVGQLEGNLRIEDIVPGTKVKVYGAREHTGPVVIEILGAENGFLWPIDRRTPIVRRETALLNYQLLVDAWGRNPFA